MRSTKIKEYLNIHELNLIFDCLRVVLVPLGAQPVDKKRLGLGCGGKFSTLKRKECSIDVATP